MQEALTLELERHCGNPECGMSLAQRPGPTVRYCSVACRGRARILRAIERCKDLKEKPCTACKEIKPIGEFTRAHDTFCKSCTAAKRKKNYQRPGRGKDRVYAKNLERNYGMTMDQYEEKVRQQGGQCAICGITPNHRLHVDHDHRTGAVRDLLCRPCNYALGQAQDSLRIARAMVTYLESHAREDAENRLSLRTAPDEESNRIEYVAPELPFRGQRHVWLRIMFLL